MGKQKCVTQQGFTLAEVLITLGIIGIIAEMTIPTLVQKADERAIIVALKKNYSVLSSAYKLAENDEGTPDNWDIGTGCPMLSWEDKSTCD